MASPRITVHIADPAGELTTFLFFTQKNGQSKRFKPKKLVLNDSAKSLTICGTTGSV